MPGEKRTLKKYVVVVEAVDKNQQPQPFAGLGKWIRQLYEEVEVDDQEKAFDTAQLRVTEREGVTECEATGFADKVAKESRIWKSAT
jgi:hypothetical protein